jgi:adenosylcobinamide-phosphate synthase
MAILDRSRATALGLLAGVALDQALGDPRRGHPVALFGSVASRLESRMWRDRRGAGVSYTALLVGAVAALGLAASRAGSLAPGGPCWRVAATAAGTWAVLGGRSLASEAAAIEALLAAGDLPAARLQLSRLVGRRTEHLDEGEIARAAIESVAENTSDAIVAPLLWGAVAGLPGLLAYRAVNTLDAMVGHHSPRYENFGWAAARADDIANYLPARLTAALTALVAPVAGGRGRAALAVTRRDGRRHPSPNSGMCEAAVAGALGVRLGGRNDYDGRVEDRPILGGAGPGTGGGRPPRARDIGRAIRLSRAVTMAAAAACAALAVALGSARRGHTTLYVWTS